MSTAGIGPSVAIPDVVRRGGISIEDVDVFEVNEAFASQVYPNSRLLVSSRPFRSSDTICPQALCCPGNVVCVEKSASLAMSCWLYLQTSLVRPRDCRGTKLTCGCA